MKNYILLLGLILFVSCDRQESVLHNRVLDVAQMLKKEIEVPLSEFSDSIDYVLLETNDSILLHQNAYVFYADNSDLFIRSKQSIFHFDSKGRFLNRIGKMGDGPHEYNVIYNVSVDDVNKRLFLYVGQKKIYVMNYDGQFLYELNLKVMEDVTAAYLINENRILAETRAYSNNGIKVALSLFNMQGECIKKDLVVFGDDLKTDLHMHTMPYMYACQNMVRYMSSFSNMLYGLQNEAVVDSMVFDFKNYQPDRSLIENMNKRNDLLRNYASLVDIQENSNTMFLLVIFREELRGMVVDKNTGITLFSSFIDMPQRGGGVKNDYLYNCNFWPTYMNDNALYSLAPVELIKESLSVSDSFKRKIKDDDNPVLLKILL